MRHREYETPEVLRDAIKCFWHTRKNFRKQEPEFEVIPDGYAEIIFYFGGTCSIVHDGERQPLPSPFIVGLLNQPAVFHTDNNLEIVGIRCFPWTVFDLLGLPSARQAVHIFEHPIAGLQPALAECMDAGKVAYAVQLLAQYLVDMRSHVATDSILHKAGNAMRQANGTMPVGEIAAAAHATVRTLERKFKQSSGHTVKDVAALMRFEQVRNRLWSDPYSNLAHLAYELGYTDQAHLTKEFKRYSGTTPSAFARKAKKGRQAVSGDFVAFIQA